MASSRAVALCAGAALAAGLTWAVARRWLRGGAQPFHEVVFFPAEGGPAAGSGCEAGDAGAPRPAAAAAALHCVLRRLQAARRSLDVCVFVLSSPELAAALVAAARRGCRVRVILDEEMSSCTGSQLTELQRHALPVLLKPKPFLMHHKFAVVDSQVLVCGSFNWTRQAALGNNEDVIITNNTQLVVPFISEFEKLWKLKR